MPQTHVLEEQDSLRTPFVGSVLLHAGVFGLLLLSTFQFQRAHETWGGPTHAGDIVTVGQVKTIPLPSRKGPINPVANDTESQVQQAPKPEPKKKVQVEEKAIRLKSRTAKQQPKPQALQRYRSEPIKPNQVFSQEAPAARTPMIQKAGTGEIGVGPNNILGDRFGAYADLVIRRVSDKWDTAGLAGQAAPIVIVTFDILRDGSIRNVQIVQRSGNSSLDYSVQRAVTDAAPFPPLPPNFDRSEANVELRFHLQR